MLIEDAHKPSNKMSLTPLIDVVFILLMFFMLATKFQTERQMQFSIALDETLMLDNKLPKIIPVLLKSQGHYQIDQHLVSKKELLQTISTYSNESNSIWFEVSSEPESQVQQLVDVMDSFHLLGIKNIEILSNNNVN